MPDIQSAFPSRVQRGHNPVGNQSAIEGCPAQRLIMLEQIIGRFGTGRIEAVVALLINRRPQNRFAQTTGTAVNQQQQAVGIDAQRRQRGRIDHGLDGLHFSEVITAANRAQRGVKGGRFQVELCLPVGEIAVPAIFESLQAFGGALRLELAL